MNILQHFVTNQNIPEYIKLDHGMFDVFIKAYYEWLELNNDSENSTNYDLYKAVGNPGYLVNNQEKIVDVDETVDKFIQYFAEEVCPIALDSIATDPRFFIKKLRDIYLAKGTPNSFKLFFKLYFNDNISIFETRDTILRASDGKYFAFPTAHFYVTDFETQLDSIDFTLAEILDSDETSLSVILEGGVVSKTPSGETIVKAQFASNVELTENTTYYIKSSDKVYQIKVKPLVSLSEITLSKTAGLYEANDPIYFESSGLGKRFFGSVTSVSSGTVEGIKVRNRGVYYSPNDYFKFENPEGKTDGSFTITETGNSGDILSVNNIKLRTGSNNNGYIAGTLEDAFVGITNGGSWDTLPNIKYYSNSSAINISSPYPAVVYSGVGFQVIPYSTSIGKVNNIQIGQETFFKDSDDVRVNAPASILVENNTLKVGDKIAFQVFGNDANYHPFRDDSESVIIGINYIKEFVTESSATDSEVNRIINVAFPYAFDSETFEWKYKNIPLDSRTPPSTFWNPLKDVLDSESNINYRILREVDYTHDVIDGGFTQTEYKIVVTHSFNDSDIQIQSVQNIDIPYSSTGLIDNATFQNHVFDSLKDSEVFDAFESFMTSSHGGNVSINTVLMVDIDDIDGGVDIDASYDSEYDGGFIGEFYDEIVTSFDTFEGAYGKASIMKVTFDDWFADSEVIGNASFDEDSDNITNTFDGGLGFEFVDYKARYIEIEYQGAHLSSLDETHFNAIQTVDSDILQVNLLNVKESPRILDNNEDSDVGEWVDTGHYGEVIGVGHNNKVVKVITYGDSVLPTLEELTELSAEKYNVIKLSPLKDGVSIKDYSLPLTNIAHHIERIEVSYKTTVVSNLFRKFYNQDGFISSDFGGTIQDNYYYSDYSYRIRTQLPMQDWKEKVKTMLHPAGMVMTSDYVQNLQVNIGVNKADFKSSDSFRTNLTFDKQQEYIDLQSLSTGISTDGVYYKSNAFEALSLLTGKATALESSSFTSVPNLLLKQQSGNAWWDYEPVGLVRKQKYDVVRTNGNYLNLDSELLFENRITTQDSDGSGFVKNDYSYYQNFDGSSQDFYKNQSRVPSHLNKDIMVSKVQFEDASLNKYSVYDSELPRDFVADFSDSDFEFKSIDYNRIKDSENDSRTFKYFRTDRTLEIMVRKEKDLRLAMREENALVFDDSDKVYYDYEAYERKWNQINNRRTLNDEGWSIKGYNQMTAFTHTEQRSKRRGQNFDPVVQKYATKIAPHSKELFAKETLVWDNSYYDQINNITVGTVETVPTYKDPKVSMRGRRRGR